MSPVEYPSAMKDTTPLGSLFTLFLHCPIKAFAFLSDITQAMPDAWANAVDHLDETEKLIVGMLEDSEELGISINQTNHTSALYRTTFCVSFAPGSFSPA
jgi:hypothetical protein